MVLIDYGRGMSFPASYGTAGPADDEPEPREERAGTEVPWDGYPHPCSVCGRGAYRVSDMGGRRSDGVIVDCDTDPDDRYLGIVHECTDCHHGLTVEGAL